MSVSTMPSHHDADLEIPEVDARTARQAFREA